MGRRRCLFHEPFLAFSSAFLAGLRVGFVKRTHIYARRRQLSNLASRLLLRAPKPTYDDGGHAQTVEVFRRDRGTFLGGLKGEFQKPGAAAGSFRRILWGKKLAGIDGISGWGYEIDKKTLYRGRSRYQMHCSSVNNARFEKWLRLAIDVLKSDSLSKVMLNLSLTRVLSSQLES